MGIDVTDNGGTGFNDNDPKAKEAGEPFEKAIGYTTAQQKQAALQADGERKRLVEESLLQMDKSIASSRLGSAISIGGNPQAVLAARQALARASTEESLKPIDRELGENSEAIKAGRGLNGLSLEELKTHNDKLKAQRVAIAAAGEDEVTRMTVEEARRRETSLYNIDRGIADGRMSIMRDTAKNGEEQLAASHAAIAEKTKRELADIDDRLTNPTIGADERAKLREQKGTIADAGTAAGRKLDEDEGRRRAASLIGIEHSIARDRLSILAANAHDVKALWSSTEGAIRENTQEQLDAVDTKLKDINITEAERNRLLEERKGIVDAGDAATARAKRDFDIDIRRSQQSTAGGLIGLASHMLGNRQAMFGGNNPAAIRMQKQLGIMGDVLSMNQQIESVLNDPKASADQKRAAMVASQSLASYRTSALSDKNLNKSPYEPLRFSEAEEASGNYEGRAEFQQESDENDYAKSGNMLDEQKETNRLLAAIVDMQGKGTDRTTSNPLFPN